MLCSGRHVKEAIALVVRQCLSKIYSCYHYYYRVVMPLRIYVGVTMYPLPERQSRDYDSSNTSLLHDTVRGPGSSIARRT